MKTSQAYWRDGSKSGMPTGSAPQGIYMVTSGKHFNSGCCFDYGNGETSRTYVAGPSMDSVNFSNCTQLGPRGRLRSLGHGRFGGRSLRESAVATNNKIPA